MMFIYKYVAALLLFC